MSSSNWDLLLVTDATYSMDTHLTAIAQAIPEIIALGTLSGTFKRFGVLAYGDYSEGPEITHKNVFEWFGWDNPQIQSALKNIQPKAGGDIPEAVKTALVLALKYIDPEKKTLIIWYADAPPHHSTNDGYSNSNGTKETAALAKLGQDSDWVRLSQQARDKNCTIFSVIHQGMGEAASRFFALLSSFTGGKVVTIPASTSEEISQLTLDLLLAWMGEPLAPAKYRTSLLHFKNPPDQASPALTDEDEGSFGYLPSKTASGNKQELLTTPLERLEDANLRVLIKPLDLAKKFLDQEAQEYRGQVHNALYRIIDYNVVALTYNPVFGQLWRAVCKDRANPERDALVSSFSNQVGREKDPVRKKTLNDWLEESYDHEAEIQEIIEKASDAGDPNQKRIYLDLDSGVNLTRAEVLEVARSLHPGVLKKLASILTHLKVVEKDVVLLSSQRSIPLSLSPFKIFKILPHLVVSGTMFSGRAAALFAALSMVVGVPFLDKPARVLLSHQKGTWLDLTIPENLSYECAKLLMSLPPDLALTEEERNIYAGMRRYRLIELNWQSRLNVIIPWTPEKSSGVGDRQVECRECKKRRSVTIMAPNQVCGICRYEIDRLDAIAQKVKGAEDLPPVSGDLSERNEQEIRWVECGKPTCRAQYAVVMTEALQIRPKCHFCRQGIECPWVTCYKCTNRIIIPEEYREGNDDQFECFACQSGKTTKVDEETNIRELVAENGTEWLGFNPNFNLFHNMSIFKMYSKYGAAAFTGIPAEKELTMHSKHIFNTDVVRLQIEGQVASGEVEKGTCSLCFDDIRYEKLLPACGRSGCKQRVDEDCLARWYGENKPGKLLNPLQLACPFCRRKPTTKVLTKYNASALSVGDLAPAIADRAWYYAWCMTCGFAKQAVERACADAGLPDIKDFVCEECTEQRAALEARLRAEAEALRAAQDEAGLAVVNNQLRAINATQMAKITPCPRCGVFVQKTYGCNHITCNCGAHFCYIDGLEFTEDTIYTHLMDAHGAYGDDDGGYDSEEDD